MKTALVPFNPTVGAVAANTARMIREIENAIAQDCGLIVFPEMSLIGYPAQDLLFLQSLYHAQNQALARLRRYSKKITIVVGGFAKNSGPGAPYFNAAFILQNGQKAVYHKQLLPNYDVFNEPRYFANGNEAMVIKMGAWRFGISICEDIWFADPALHKRYATDPLATYSNRKVDYVLNLSASPFEINKAARREKLLTKIGSQNNWGLIYVNQSGANDALVFDGAVSIVKSGGAMALRSELFDEKTVIANLNTLTNAPKAPLPNEIEGLKRALITGIRDFFAKSGFQKAVLGLSGGIDSALVAHLACLALGKSNVLGVLLPSRYSSDHSRHDAEELAKNLGMPTQTVEIEPLHKAYEKTFDKIFGKTPVGEITAQNIQARLRGNLLMAIANNTGALLLNTTNKSEMAMGYGTLYGDLCGALSVISDLTKQQVYALAKHLNPHFECIPKNCFDKAPSAELKPGQKDSDTLPEYEQLDPFVAAAVEHFAENPEHNDWQKRLLQNEHKRFQAPPGLKVSARAFGADWQMPIVKGNTL